MAYEAMLASGRRSWSFGERVRVYRTQNGSGRLVDEESLEHDHESRRDYDVEHYVQQLRDTFAARLVRAFKPEDFALLFADPMQPSLFPIEIDAIRSVLYASDSSTYQSSWSDHSEQARQDVQRH
jgi:hypothetical protein